MPDYLTCLTDCCSKCARVLNMAKLYMLRVLNMAQYAIMPEYGLKCLSTHLNMAEY